MPYSEAPAQATAACTQAHAAASKIIFLYIKLNGARDEIASVPGGSRRGSQHAVQTAAKVLTELTVFTRGSRFPNAGIRVRGGL